jgi:hypothetical protein
MYAESALSMTLLKDLTRSRLSNNGKVHIFYHLWVLARLLAETGICET